MIVSLPPKALHPAPHLEEQSADVELLSAHQARLSSRVGGDILQRPRRMLDVHFSQSVAVGDGLREPRDGAKPGVAHLEQVRLQPHTILSRRAQSNGLGRERERERERVAVAPDRARRFVS